MQTIVQKEDPVLRQTATLVPIEDIRGRKIETVIRRMIKALNAEDDGIAIAAPQIGESLRIFVVSHKVFDMLEEERKEEKKGKKKQDEDISESEEKFESKDIVFINPEILKTSKEQNLVEEGCLSVRWLYGQVKRSKKVLIKALDEEGKPFTFGGSGLMAQIFQHEIDHLNGVLFIDKARGIKEMPPEKYVS